MQRRRAAALAGPLGGVWHAGLGGNSFPVFDWDVAGVRDAREDLAVDAGIVFDGREARRERAELVSQSRAAVRHRAAARNGPIPRCARGLCIAPVAAAPAAAGAAASADSPAAGGQGDVTEKMVFCFKVLPCDRTTTGGARGGKPEHDHRSCAYYHGERDRRRRVVAFDGQTLYSALPCPHRFDDRRVCPYGEDCTLCHSTSELLYHPEFFRKRLCHQAGRSSTGGI
ncbi:unnamed protein product [Prorocentrum cordatum]|uniref:C3H1-type domain-containing protein n=1 Tax=Prorocentrum cordatum TaxID=2364126 RepID=A0ABN9T1A5_9DINO|nr:unnamed protein product [Polarella glacialis]